MSRYALPIAVGLFVMAACNDSPAPPAAPGLIGTPSAASAKANVIHVPKDYPTIQQGVDAAASGGLVLVQGGSYAEHVVIATAGVTLRGVAGASLTGAVGIEADDVSLEGFTIYGTYGNQTVLAHIVSGASIKNNTLVGGPSNQWRGIWLRCQDCSVVNNDISGYVGTNGAEGINVQGPGNDIRNNYIHDTARYGIFVGVNGTDNVIRENRFSNNDLCDIRDTSAGNTNTYKNNRLTCQQP